MRAGTVVVIEDDPAINDAVRMILNKSGHQVHSFTTIEAFERASAAPVDVYIVDRQLKDGDGIELCRRLKSSEATRHVPVIIMSATPGTRQFTQDACADAFLEKPFSKKQLLAAIERFITPGTGIL